jgi:hypothetical protein
MYNPNIHKFCRMHLKKYVEINMVDGRKYRGFIDRVGHKNVYLLVPTDPYWVRDAEKDTNRQFGYPYPGYPGYGYVPGYPSAGPYPFPRRRYSRIALPLAFIAGLAARPLID